MYAFLLFRNVANAYFTTAALCEKLLSNTAKAAVFILLAALFLRRNNLAENLKRLFIAFFFV